LQIQANAQVVNNISGEPPQHNNESKLATESGMEDFFLNLQTNLKQKNLELMRNLRPGNYCYISSNGQKDSAGRYCDQTYGISYDGYIVNNLCYYRLETAYETMDKMLFCYNPPPLRNGRCKISNPKEKDEINRYCDKAYGVTYRRSIVNNQCYYKIENAIRYMNSSRFCYRRPRTPFCHILNPGRKDRSGRYCDKAYGIAHRGQIVNNTCYFKIENAITNMESYGFCR